MSEPPHKTKTPNPPMPLIIPTMSYIDEPTRSFEESTTNSRKRKGTPQSNLTLSDCQQCIRDALAEKRISYNKANRLHDCLNSESLTEVIYKLLCEQIPNKRSKTSGGYKCKLCALPLKGHIWYVIMRVLHLTLLFSCIYICLMKLLMIPSSLFQCLLSSMLYT